VVAAFSEAVNLARGLEGETSIASGRVSGL